MTPLGLYIHWPFCARICPYCDFNVYKDRGVDARDWSRALIADLRYWAERIERRPLASIYFGGGTPSLAPISVIADVIDAASCLFGLEEHAEITLEANPNNAETERFESFASVGVNRLSLGIQSFNDQALKFLGRDHDGASARKALEQAKTHFDNTTFDLIYALPDQSLEDWRGALNEALSFSPTHLSMYQLTIEPGTAFARQVEAQRWTPSDDDTQARQYELAQEMTAAAGLPAYEISNHAAPGKQSKHNLIYWRYQDYIGIGPGAHGRVTLDGARCAAKAHDRPDAYLKNIDESGVGVESIEMLDAHAQMIERFSMGLRVLEGMSLDDDDIFFADEARAKALAQMIEAGFVRRDQGRLFATATGRPLLNRLIYELIG